MTIEPAELYNCRRCPRLAAHLDQVRNRYPEYYAHPVSPFGDETPRLLIVGLAPGLHGANASGRPFTGDFAGILLYQTLFEFGFSNRAESVSRDDGLFFRQCRITNAVKCLPPENKPVTSEINTCNRYLVEELRGLMPNSVILALGVIAHKAVLRALDLKQSKHPFKHAQCYALAEKAEKAENRWLLDSYHCSRYNTQTKRLTPEMFRAVFAKARDLLE
ncbi:MAG: uracil-DNA glycosylase [Gammaproteobacteria bacterium]|nr:uracil-DNA glycosylase [Gammaproteobacteria bacterium]